MKKLLAMMVTATMVIGLMAGCGSKEAATEETATEETTTEETATEETTNSEEAEATGTDADTADGMTFTVGFDAEFPPYGYMDENGEYTGFDLELAQEVCDRNGWTLVKQPIDWDAKDMELSSGSIDCIWNGFTMNGREDQYTFSVPYVDNSQVFVVKADSGITTVWQQRVAADMDHAPADSFPEQVMFLNVPADGSPAQWEMKTRVQLRREAQKGHQSLRDKYTHKEKQN